MLPVVRSGSSNLSMTAQCQSRLVGKGTMLAVQHAEPFVHICNWLHSRGANECSVVPRVGVTQVLLYPIPQHILTSCFQGLSTLIRSDSKNLLELCMTMREADKVIIRAAGRDEERDAVVIFKQKMTREGAYRVDD